jgi:periplasmic copper chaperone A
MTSHIFGVPGRRVAFASIGAFIWLGLSLTPIFSQPVFAHDFKAGSLTIDHPSASPTRGTVPVNAGYMTIINAGTVPDRLISATSPEAARVELHEHVRASSGMMQMRQVQGGIAVPARGRVRFEPGGLHLMIFNPKAPLRDGGTFPIILTFERAGRVEVVAMVEAPSPSSNPHRH